ncbi:MAG: MBL fold metallo-hydrolase [Methanomassiliicoccales archaeon]
MLLEKFKSKGLAHLSYLIGSGSEAMVVDPRRDCDAYLERTRQEEMEIGYILETHRNEDYVIGSRELSSLTGARIMHGGALDFGYGEVVEDGDELPLGNLKVVAMSTPGHTDESMSYLLVDPRNDQPIALFSGDALFVGDVGRTDLYGEGKERRMASALYHSLFDRILPLGDEVILCPAHGAGSVCGKAISERELSTLGIERRTNPALQAESEEEFVSMKVGEMQAVPPYFRRMEEYNLEGPPMLQEAPVPRPLPPEEFQGWMDRGAVVVDTRGPPGFSVHIGGSYSIWIEGIPSFAGCVLPHDTPLLLVLDDMDRLKRAWSYLVRLGYDNVVGYLKGGIDRWIELAYPTERLGLLTAKELKKALEETDMMVLDVRPREEFLEGHIEGAMNIYCGELERRVSEVPKDRPVAVVCSVGYRGTMGASILSRAGCIEANIVVGGTAAWESAGYPVVRGSGQ